MIRIIVLTSRARPVADAILGVNRIAALAAANAEESLVVGAAGCKAWTRLATGLEGVVVLVGLARVANVTRGVKGIAIGAR